MQNRIGGYTGVIAPDPRLDAALARLHGRKLIHTNGSVRHAENVLRRLGVRRHFEAVFDIAAADYDLSFNRYREEVIEEVEYDPPETIIAELRELEGEIAKGLDTLEGMLR